MSDPMLFTRALRAAHDHPHVRAFLLPVLAKEIPNQKALKT